MSTKTLQQITEAVVAFRDQRDWKQFHRPKDMALSLVLEASEVAELFQWKSEADIQATLPELKDALGRELSDVLYWVLLMAHDAGINLEQAFVSKMRENEMKYPVDRAKGSSKKYTDL